MAVPILSGFEHKVVVGIADFAVSNNPSVILTTYSLGSCLGISIYDPVVKVAGLLHIMLPDSSIDTAKAARSPAMFLDTGFPMLLKAAAELRAESSRLQICVAGGAQIMDSVGFFNIGKRNHVMMMDLLSRNALRLKAEEVGGMVNRTMHVHISSGDVVLKVSGNPKESYLCKNSTTI